MFSEFNNINISIAYFGFFIFPLVCFPGVDAFWSMYKKKKKSLIIISICFAFFIYCCFFCAGGRFLVDI